MNTAAQRGGDYVAHYGEIQASLPGQDLPWLRVMRQEALAKFAAGGFPSPREEEWRYTNVSPIEKKLFRQVSGAGGEVAAHWLDRYCLKDAWRLVLVDGRFSPRDSALEGLPEGVVVTAMAEALSSHAEEVQKRLGSAVEKEDHGFIHFNTAHFTDGVFIRIGAGRLLEKPIQVIHVTAGADSLSSTRSLVVAEPGSEACVVQTFVGTAEAGYLTAAVTEVLVEDNASLNIHTLQAEGEKSFHFGGVYARQARHGILRHHAFAFGAVLARSEVHADLDHGADCVLNGLYLGAGRQHLDNHTRVNHLKPHGTSRELYKGILDQRARGVFQGRVIVHPDAQKTDSEMNNRNLLLSLDAEADTKPQLEIYADDVKCAHGVTVGQLDEESVFYLRSRGVEEASARNMLTFAFANEMVEKIDLGTLRSVVQDLLLARIPQTDIRREWL